MTRKSRARGNAAPATEPRSSAGEGTRQRLLDAAEKLFAARSFSSVSVRMVTTKAKQNLAAVNYHFGSKEGLLEAVYLRRGLDLNAERRALLQEAEDRAAGRALSLETLLHSILSPSVRWALDTRSGKATFILFLFRSYHESTPALKKLRLKEAEALRETFLPWLRRALPGTPDEDLYWGIQFALGAMHYTIGDLEWVKAVSGDACDISSIDSMIHRLVTFAAGGFGELAKRRLPAQPGARAAIAALA
jgi:AcrR family transcriptional regulator